jgi:hypothetical protein
MLQMLLDQIKSESPANQKSKAEASEAGRHEIRPVKSPTPQEMPLAPLPGNPSLN